MCNSAQVGPSTSWALVLCTCCTIHCYFLHPSRREWMKEVGKWLTCGYFQGAGMRWEQRPAVDRQGRTTTMWLHSLHSISLSRSLFRILSTHWSDCVYVGDFQRLHVHIGSCLICADRSPKFACIGNSERRFQRPHACSKTSQQETPSSIYKWFILPETSYWSVSCRWQYGSTFISFHVTTLESRTL